MTFQHAENRMSQMKGLKAGRCMFDDDPSGYVSSLMINISQGSGRQRGVRRESSKVARSSNKVAKLADYPVKCL
jgi:hypothetical protein